MPTKLPQANVTERHASLFRNGRNQTVRIPREFERWAAGRRTGASSPTPTQETKEGYALQGGATAR